MTDSIEAKKEQIMSEFAKKLEELEKDTPVGVLDYHMKERLKLQDECVMQLRTLCQKEVLYIHEEENNDGRVQ